MNQSYGKKLWKGMAMKQSRSKISDVDIEALFINGDLIDKAINDAVKEAIERHKKLSQPIVIWRDGKILTIAPEDIDKEVA